ncbi:hypothetical protein [Hymenobacter cellulosilyticus]|uniref:Mechanosensitive ion channel family protein n=1 Tax=Hymenobacter cellulosilyticus TaxID=2932248 RepID=A0A8T9PZD7_9BACT|nr:hypothetical protein [Hymenobacter cellulosilyticus]UOQ70115.1 hypothetical protein MUN79_15210 [Hymenobacter cellulosilyticus]
MKETVAHLLSHFPDIFATLGILLGGLLLGLVLKYAVFSVLRAFGRREDSVLARSVAQHLNLASAWFFPVLTISLLLPWCRCRPSLSRCCAAWWKWPWSSPLPGA